jgi:hypothetical protein
MGTIMTGSRSAAPPYNAALERLTPLERVLWTKTIARQYEDKSSKYWKNVDKYGTTGSALVSVTLLWILFAFPSIPLIIIAQVANIPYLEAVSIVGALLLCGIASLRGLAASREGKRFRSSNTNDD